MSPKKKVRNTNEAENAIWTLSISHLCPSLYGHFILLPLKTSFLWSLLHKKKLLNVHFQIPNVCIIIRPPEKKKKHLIFLIQLLNFFGKNSEEDSTSKLLGKEL